MVTVLLHVLCPVQVVFITDNGAGAISTTFKLPAKNSLCDGNWHTIRGEAFVCAVHVLVALGFRGFEPFVCLFEYK